MQTIPVDPDYHFLLFAPGLGTWIFRAARRYWTQYRPVLYSMRTPDDVDLVTYASGNGRVLAVTLVMRRDTADTVRAAVATKLSGIYLDPLVYDNPADLQITLNARVEFDQRFGIPQDLPPTPTPARTPGPITG